MKNHLEFLIHVIGAQICIWNTRGSTAETKDSTKASAQLATSAAQCQGQRASKQISSRKTFEEAS